MRFAKAALVTLAILSAGTAAAQRQYGMAGCGLGAVIIGKSESRLGQLGATCSNGTSGNQTFGITSGTSNCLTDDQLAALTKQQQFLAANLATLQKEMSQGGGETVVGFMEVLGCSADVIPSGSAQLLDAYERIFAAPGIDGVLEAAKNELRPTMLQACKHLS